MKKKSYIVLKRTILWLAWVVVFSAVSVALAAGQVRNPNPIVIKDQTNYQSTNETAYVNSTETLIPLAVVQRYFDESASYLPSENMITFAVNSGRLRLGGQLQDQFKDKVTLSFPAVQINNQPFLDITNLDSLFGIGIQFDYNGNLVLERNAPAVERFPVSSAATPGVPSGKINLVWDVRAKGPALSREEPQDGPNVLSPTWFAIVQNNGRLSNKADRDYVAQAHEQGYKVWALITNSFDPNLTHEILANDAAEQQVIDQLVFYASYYNLDGINLDFENIYDYDKNNLSFFPKK